uniref:Uncharacterized protein n=1 Tax=Peronospora matthiolae TaxID=2874970 RepID=A0AAV1TIN6_9STRA
MILHASALSAYVKSVCVDSGNTQFAIKAAPSIDLRRVKS